jgi:hypothetical protein
MEDTNVPQVFAVRHAEHFFQARLTQPILGLFKDLPELLEHLLSTLGSHGLRLAGIKFEPAADSLGDMHLKLSVPRCVIRLYLDRIEIDSGSFVEPINDLIAGVVGALSTRSPEATFESYVVRHAFHGNVAEIPAAQFLSRFVALMPDAFGSPIGSGAIFYYGPGPETFAASVTIDLSRLYGDGMFFQVHAIYNASAVALDALDSLSSQKLRDVLGMVDSSWLGFCGSMGRHLWKSTCRSCFGLG